MKLLEDDGTGLVFVGEGTNRDRLALKPHETPRTSAFFHFVQPRKFHT